MTHWVYIQTTDGIWMCGGNGINVHVCKNRYKSILQYPRPSRFLGCKHTQKKLTTNCKLCAIFYRNHGWDWDTQTISLSSWNYLLLLLHDSYLMVRFEHVVVVWYSRHRIQHQKPTTKKLPFEFARPRGQVSVEPGRDSCGNYLIFLHTNHK